MTDEREAQRAEIKAAWSDAGDRLSGLGAKLKQHYAEHQGGTEPEPAGSEVKEAVKRLGVAVQDAFEAIGTAAQDEAVKKDVKDVGQSVASALGATFTVIGDEVRKALDTPKGAVQDRPTEGGSQGGRTAPAPEPDRPPVQDAPTIVDPPITMEEPPPASPEADR